MAVRFVRPDGHSQSAGLCERNLNLLAHAQAIELDIGSRCGGHGICGSDRVRIAPGERDRFSPVTTAERELLTAEQLEQGWRLACQCFPESNDIEVALETL